MGLPAPRLGHTETFKLPEMTAGTLAVRAQELHERLLGTAPRQQCSRSIYCTTLLHASFLLSRIFFIEPSTDEALYLELFFFSP